MSSFFRSAPSTAAPPPPPVTTTVPTSPTIRQPPTQPPALTGEHLEAYETVLGHFTQDGYAFPAEAGGESVLSDGERMWVTRECIERYLRAERWNTETAITRIEATLNWRREVGISDDDSAQGGLALDGVGLEIEGKDGDDFVVGWDESGHPLHYQYSARNTSNDGARNLRSSFWVLERVQDLMPAGIEKQVLLVNFTGAAGKIPAVSVVKGFISVLSNHYPETMERAIAINVPWVIHQLLKVVLPFMDPVTRAKLSFNQPTPFIPDDQLLVDFGGQLNLDPRAPEYRQSLIALCRERRQAYRERWVQGGAQIGASEWVLKGGDVTPAP